MAKEIPVRWLLIVTGSTLRAEEMDRPLGYYLKQRIEDCLSQATTNGQSGLEDYLVRIVADFRWIHDEPLQSLPTISLGGPGVNALSHRWMEEVPVSLAFSERYFIQMDPDLAEPRGVSGVWIMPAPKSPFPCSSIGFYHDFSIAVPSSQHTSHHSILTVSLEPELTPTTTTMRTTAD